MNPTKSIFACLILLVAVGLVFVVREKSPTAPEEQIESAQGTTATRIAEFSNTRSGFKAAVRVAPTILDLTVTSDEPGQQAACIKVESAARLELQELDERLKLTKTQQQKIFPILVRRSAAFSPAMKAGGQALGTAPASAEDAICAELDSAREATYQEMLLDDAAWWGEALTYLESSPDESADPPLSQSSPVH